MAAGLAAAAGCAGPRPAAAPDDPGVWNFHCHLSGLPGASGPEKVARALEMADRLGIGRLIFFMGAEIGPLSPSPEQLRRYNDECMEAVRPHHPRVLAFAYLSPEHPDFSLRELERCVADGPMAGVKFWCARRCRLPQIDPIVRRAAELGAPVYQHTWLKVGGNHPGESTPSDVAELAGRHPGAALICGHAGGDWEPGIRAIRASPNVALELAGFDPTAGAAEMAVRELGADRVIYGSDTGGRSFASQIAKVRGAALPDDVKRRILGGNLRRMLKPILQAKGIPA
jgi:hypothetical protein